MKHVLTRGGLVSSNWNRLTFECTVHLLQAPQHSLSQDREIGMGKEGGVQLTAQCISYEVREMAEHSD